MEHTVQPSTMNPQDERIMAALAHISAILPMMGVIAPIIIWATQKDKSRFVAYQSLQATAFQLAMLMIWFGGMACYMGTFFLMFAGGIIGSSVPNANPAFAGLFFLPVLVIVAMIGLMGILIVYALVAAVLTFQGKDFRYVLIGRWVERYQQQAFGNPR